MNSDDMTISQSEQSLEDKNENTETIDEEFLAGDNTNDSEGDDSILKVPSNVNNLSLSSTHITESMTSEDVINNSSWKLNQLAWARMSVYPFWPCMVTNDPSSMMTFQKVKTIGKSKTHMIHVHFFNDNGRHSWIPSHHMLPFDGIENFRKRASLITDMIRKKEPKFAAALTVKPNIFGTWQKAVAEAMDVLYDLDLSSLDKFKPRAKDTTNDTADSNTSVTKKRKRKTNETQKNIRKAFKADNSNHESSTNIDGSRKSNIELDNLNLETPPVSPPVEVDFRIAEYKKRRQLEKLRNKLQPPDFEVYYDRHVDIVKSQHSDVTDEEVREFLLHEWENEMTFQEKLKYRGMYKTENHSHIISQ